MIKGNLKRYIKLEWINKSEIDIKGSGKLKFSASTSAFLIYGMKLRPMLASATEDCMKRRNIWVRKMDAFLISIISTPSSKLTLIIQLMKVTVPAGIFGFISNLHQFHFFNLVPNLSLLVLSTWTRWKVLGLANNRCDTEDNRP